ncbi:MAG: hypothetical protein NC324_09190 [Bacteroides sp.]|nr:hypothetical protein [Bacteroides sp.]
MLSIISDFILAFSFMVMILMVALSCYIFSRNGAVYRFMIMINELAYAASMQRIGANRSDFYEPRVLADKYEYNDMLYSFKPLKLEDWYTEEEIRTLKGEN